MRAILSALFLLTAACSPAPQTESGVVISEAWASPTPGGADVSAGYLTIANDTAEPDRLTGASSPRAARVEIHTMDMQDGVMRMRPAGDVTVGAHEMLVLAPGGLHIMFMELTAPFAEGEEIPLRLTFEHAGAIDVALPVRRQGGHASH